MTKLITIQKSKRVSVPSPSPLADAIETIALYQSTEFFTNKLSELDRPVTAHRLNLSGSDTHVLHTV